MELGPWGISQISNWAQNRINHLMIRPEIGERDDSKTTPFSNYKPDWQDDHTVHKFANGMIDTPTREFIAELAIHFNKFSN